MSDSYARGLPLVLTLEQAADLLQVSKRTLQRRIGAEELAAFKIGRQYRTQRPRGLPAPASRGRRPLCPLMYSVVTIIPKGGKTSETTSA